MTPSLKPGQVVVAMKPWRSLRTGDVIVFKHGSLEKIKRVARIEKDGIYVLGDNLTASTDSREFGAIPLSTVSGIVLWPKRPVGMAQPSNITE